MIPRIAKSEQGYTDSPIHKKCRNCKYLRLEVIEKGGVVDLKNPSCSIGKFSVKLGANCNKHKFIYEK